jgi:hypothetical protein
MGGVWPSGAPGTLWGNRLFALTEYSYGVQPVRIYEGVLSITHLDISGECHTSHSETRSGLYSVGLAMIQRIEVSDAREDDSGDYQTGNRQMSHHERTRRLSHDESSYTVGGSYIS